MQHPWAISRPTTVYSRIKQLCHDVMSRKGSTAAGSARSNDEVRPSGYEQLHLENNDSNVTYADIMTLNPPPVDTPENVYANANQEQPDVVYSELAANNP